MSQVQSVLDSPTGVQVAQPGDTDPVVIVRDSRVRTRLMLASAALLVLGLAMFYESYAVGLGRAETLFLAIAGMTAVMLAVLLFYFSPAKFLRNDVCDAMCVTGAEFMHRTVAPLGVSKPVYVPSSLSGEKRTLLMVSAASYRAALPDGIRVAGRGFEDRDIFVEPPGNGLMEHARRLGATFTDEGLEDEIRDVLVNGFELAGNVRIGREKDRISVELRKVATSSLCGTLRKRQPGICTGTGCPLCSFVGCMIAEGTGRRTALDEAKARGGTIRMSFRLT